MKLFIKFYTKHILRFLLHLFWIFPVDKKKVYFTSFHGLRFSCNPKYLYNYLLKEFGAYYKYVWEFKTLEKSFLVPDAKSVSLLSLKSFFHILTSSVIITNNDFQWWIPLRKSQCLLQTWHGGGAYKKVGVYEKWDSYFQKEQKLIAKQISWYVSSSKKFTEVQSVSKFVPPEKFINTGMPRNSILFDKKKIDALKEKIHLKFNIPSSNKIVLYAPTFRGKPQYKINAESEYKVFDYKNLTKELSVKFDSDFVFFYRGHHINSKQKINLPEYVVDVSDYEDMQELLCAADVLVTDYSSTMWDFALTKKPCFLFTPDLSYYISERGFYTEPHTWPFPLAENEQDLLQNIKKFNGEAYVQDVQKYLDDYTSYENLNSNQRICEIIGLVGKNGGEK